MVCEAERLGVHMIMHSVITETAINERVFIPHLLVHSAVCPTLFGLNRTLLRRILSPQEKGLLETDLP